MAQPKTPIKLALLAAAALTLAAVGALPAQEVRRVYVVPLDDFPVSTVTRLQHDYRARYGLTVDVLPRLDVPDDAAFDAGRQQLVAQELIALIKRSRPDLASEPRVTLIGLTREDMYIRGVNWRFALGRYEEGRFGVISDARMDPALYPSGPACKVILRALLKRIGIPYTSPTDPDLRYTRLRKMTMRYIGFLHLRLPPSNDRKSVLYRPILGVDDLDAIGEDF